MHQIPQQYIKIQVLRAACKPFYHPHSLKTCVDLLGFYSKFLFDTVKNHHQEKAISTGDHDAKIILQMMLTKVLHLKSIILGAHYVAEDGTELRDIVDPTVAAVLIRNIYETVGTFNLIYRNTKTPDQKLILYNLWVHAGLSYRQKFNSKATSAESMMKSENDRQKMSNLVQEIGNSTLYKNLSDKSRSKINQRIKERNYLIKFSGNEIDVLHWHQLASLMGCQGKLLDEIYTYFSLYAHPSNVSVFQYAQMFNNERKVSLVMAAFNLRIAFIFISIFIADYISTFPLCLQTYDNLPIVQQIIIDWHNRLIRGNDYSINNSWHHLSYKIF